MPPTPRKDLVTVYPTGIKIRISPDETVADWPDHIPVPSRIGVFEWSAQADGAYKPKIRLQNKMVKMSLDVPEELGLGCSYKTLRRLMIAGFVASEQVSPGQYAFDLQSFYQHRAKVRADPEFWTGANLRRFMEAT